MFDVYKIKICIKKNSRGTCSNQAQQFTAPAPDPVYYRQDIYDIALIIII